VYAFSSASVSGALRDDAGTPRVDDNSGRCLDVLGGSREPATPLVIYDCHGGENQRFTYPPVSGTGEVRAYGGTMCLDAYPGRGQDGDRIVVWPCHGGANRQWTRTLGGRAPRRERQVHRRARCAHRSPHRRRALDLPRRRQAAVEPRPRDGARRRAR